MWEDIRKHVEIFNRLVSVKLFLTLERMLFLSQSSEEVSELEIEGRSLTYFAHRLRLKSGYIWRRGLVWDLGPCWPWLFLAIGPRDFLGSIVLIHGMVWLSCLPNLSGQGCLQGVMTGSIWRERKRKYILNLDTSNYIIVNIILDLEETLEAL